MEDTSRASSVAQAIEAKFPGCIARRSDDEREQASDIVVFEVFFAAQEQKPEVRSFAFEMQSLWGDDREVVLIPYTAEETWEHFPEVAAGMLPSSCVPVNVFTVADLDQMLGADALHPFGGNKAHSWVGRESHVTGTTRRFVDRHGQQSSWQEYDGAEAA